MRKAIRDCIPKIDTMLVIVVILLAVLIAIMILPAFQLAQVQREILESQEQHNRIVETIVNESRERDNQTDKLVNKDIMIDETILTEVKDRSEENGSNR